MAAAVNNLSIYRSKQAEKNANPLGTRFSLPVLFAELLFGHGLDPLPMPDEMEEEANHHDVAAVGMDIGDDPLDGTSIAEAGEKMEVEHNASDDADEAAEEEQQVEIKILFHENPFFQSEVFQLHLV